jgi:hypothetical protein
LNVLFQLTFVLLLAAPASSAAQTDHSGSWSEVATANMSVGPVPAYKEMTNGGGGNLAQIILRSAPEAEATLIITGYSCDPELKHFSQQMIFRLPDTPATLVGRIRREAPAMLERVITRCGGRGNPIIFEGQGFESAFLKLFASFQKQHQQYEQELAKEEQVPVEESR